MRVCTCIFHWRPLRVRLHSSFQQSTMGNREPLHHLTVLVCFVAPSWCVRLTFSLLPLSVCLYQLHSCSTHTLLAFPLWWQSTPKSNCITSPMHFQHQAPFFFSSSSPRLVRGWKSPEDRRLSCVTSWYLGQWSLVMLRTRAYWHDAVSRVETESLWRKKPTKNTKMRCHEKPGCAGLCWVKSSHARTGWEHLSSESGWLMLLPPLHPLPSVPSLSHLHILSPNSCWDSLERDT